MIRVHLVVALLASCVAQVGAREWSDVGGHYHLSADLLARDDGMVVLEKGNKDLVAIKISQLSKADQAYLKKRQEEANPEMQTWTTRRGLKIKAAVVEYARRDVVIRRLRGKAYVNDRRYDNLPGVYRKMVPLIVSHFEKKSLETEKEFQEWVRSLQGKTKRYTCEGVVLELENGDLYGVPFFFFSDKDLKVLQPGWEDWSKLSDDEEAQQQAALSLRAESVANRRSQATRRQVAMLQLQLQGYQAGLFDLWEVALLPPPNVRGYPLRVVVPGRNSAQATATALQKYPGYRVGPIAKVIRRN